MFARELLWHIQQATHMTCDVVHSMCIANVNEHMVMKLAPKSLYRSISCRRRFLWYDIKFRIFFLTNWQCDNFKFESMNKIPFVQSAVKPIQVWIHFKTNCPAQMTPTRPKAFEFLSDRFYFLSSQFSNRQRSISKVPYSKFNRISFQQWKLSWKFTK